MQPIQRTLRGVKGLALLALVAIPVTAATALGSADQDTPHGSVTAAYAGAQVAPAANVPDLCHGPGALISAHGRIHEVGLVRGLLTYEHKAPGTFLRLCTVATPQGS